MIMDKSAETSVITLSRDQAFVAMAHLGKSPAYEELVKQIREKALLKMMMRVALPDLLPGQDPDNVMRACNPDLYAFTLPPEHKASLIGAFVLSLEGSVPSEPMAIEGFPAEDVRALATEARDALLSI